MMPIAIKPATHKRLLGLRLGRESYDSLLNRLADCHDEVFARPAQTTHQTLHRASGQSPSNTLNGIQGKDALRVPKVMVQRGVYATPTGRVGVEGRAQHQGHSATLSRIWEQHKPTRRRPHREHD